MANTEWTNTGVAPNGGDKVAMARGIAYELGSLMGLSLESEEVDGSGTYSWWHSIPSKPNMGVMLYYTPLNYFNIYTAYKNGDTWARYGQGYATSMCNWTEGVTAYTHSTKRIGDYTVHRINDSWFWFMEGPSLIDYFSGRQYDVLRTIHAHIAYSNDLDIMESLSGVNVGGASYPTNGRSVTVAAPMIYKNSFCYGSIGGSSAIYQLSTGTKAMGTQVQIAGHTFESLGDGIYWRLN